jgi:polar amino acid transport system substrate-binding protein
VTAQAKRRTAKTLLPRMSVILAALLIALATPWIAVPPATAQEADEDEALTVAIKPLLPFVIAEGDQYSGFSIDLWEEIARRLGRDFEYEFMETVTEQLAAVEQGQADLAITGISITREREEAIDFSLPYFEAGLQVMTRAAGRQELTTPPAILIGLVASPEFVSLMISLFAAIILMAHVFWLAERRRNSDFPSSYFKGIWEGIWYTVVTMVTVGYGDKTARSAAGRVIAMTWMFLSLFLVASFTANITTQLTMNRFYGAVQGPEDLPGKSIATVDGSTAAQYLAARRLPYTAVEFIEDAYILLEQGRVDAVVYDSPVLLYYATSEGQGRVQVVGNVFEPQDYGIALPTGSENREGVNRALLEIIEDGAYNDIYARWFERESG